MKRFIETPWFFGAIGAVFFLPFLGGVHLFDWDEINFAEIAREMVVTDHYLETFINYQVFTEKPPLFMWLQALSMNIFGIGDYAARFPNALLGVIALPVIFQLGKKLHGARFGFYWSLAWFGSILPHLYYKSGIIDPVFNFFIFLGIYNIIKYVWSKRDHEPLSKQLRLLALAGICTGLAILVKGPVAYLITGLTLGVYWVVKRFKWYISVPHFLFYSTVALAVVVVWAGINFWQLGSKFIVEFTIRQYTMLTTQDAGHGGFVGYHVVVLLVGVFPASIFAMQAMVKKDLNLSVNQADFRRWMIILFWVVLILFSIVSTKIVHYSSMCYYPITYLAALSLMNLEQRKWRVSAGLKFGLWSIGGIAALVTTILPFAGMNIDVLKPLFKNDPFAVENSQAQVPWSGFEAMAGLFLFAVLILSLLVLKNQPKKRFAILFFGMGCWMMLTLVNNIGKIESISQRAAISFWEQRQGEDCYVTTYNYKSYAHLYYARVQPPQRLAENPESVSPDLLYQKGTETMINVNAAQDWLLHGRVDKPVYISTKVNQKDKLEQEIHDAEFLYNENGFYFYRRSPHW